MNWQKVWAVNKYWVMSKSQQQYDYIRLLAKNNQWTPQKTQPQFTIQVQHPDD